MEKITICIIDNDESYKNALMGFIKTYCRNYMVNLPHVKEMGEDELRSIVASNDILLISYDHLELFRNIPDHNIENKTVVLLESFSKWDEKHTQGFNIVSKYTDINKIINYINNHYYELSSRSQYSNETMTKLVLCLGISGGAGTSSVAGGIAAELSKYWGKRVFYLSLDQFESGIDLNNGMNHERIIYSLINSCFSNENKIFENNMIETVDGVWRMPSSNYLNVFHELSLSEKKQYIQEILSNNKFDYFVVDGGCLMDEFVADLISNSDEIVVIDSHYSIKSKYMRGLLDYIKEIRTNETDPIVVENFMDENMMQTYGHAIPVSRCSEQNNKGIVGNIKFSAEIKKVVDYLG